MSLVCGNLWNSRSPRGGDPDTAPTGLPLPARRYIQSTPYLMTLICLLSRGVLLPIAIYCVRSCLSGQDKFTFTETVKDMLKLPDLKSAALLIEWFSALEINHPIILSHFILKNRSYLKCPVVRKVCHRQLCFATGISKQLIACLHDVFQTSQCELQL